MAHLAFKCVIKTKNCQHQPWKKRFSWNHHCTYPEFCQKFTLTKSSNSHMSTQTTQPNQTATRNTWTCATLRYSRYVPKNLKWIRSPLEKERVSIQTYTNHHFWVSCLVFTAKFVSNIKHLYLAGSKNPPAKRIYSPSRFHQPRNNTAFHAVKWKNNALSNFKPAKSRVIWGTPNNGTPLW